MRARLDTEFVTPRLEELYPDRRREVRFVTVYRLVKVQHAGDEGLGRCRNISDGGAKIELHMQLRLGDRVTIAFSPTDLIRGRVVWINGHEYGVIFDEPIDCMGILGQQVSPAAALQARSPRLKTNLPARVAYDGGSCRSVVSDISVRGMKIAGVTAFEPGLRVRVILEGGRECDGVIRWSHDNVAGLILLEPLAIEELGSVKRLSRPN
jgi:hypothetical protein